MFRFIISIVLSGVFLWSCRSAKNIQSVITKKDSTETVTITLEEPRFDSAQFIRDNYDRLLKNRIVFETFSAKINVDYQGSDGKKYDVNAFVRMKKDSIIWISINGLLGIEGMRVLIDKDSVRILNKLDKEYQVRAISYLQELASLPLDLATFQDIIIGNPVFLDTSIVSFTTNGNSITMLSYGEWFKHLITMNNNDHLVLNSKLDDADVLRNRTCYLGYSDYENKKGQNFSTTRVISVTEKTKLDIKLNFKQYEFNEMLTFPFSIPKNYRKIP